MESTAYISTVSDEKVISAAILEIKQYQDKFFIKYGTGGKNDSGVLRNPEILCGRLIQKSIVKMRLHSVNLYPVNHLREVSLALTEDDMLPKDFTEVFKKYPPKLKTWFGFITAPDDYKGRYYIPVKNESEGLGIISGEYRCDIIKGCTCLSADKKWLIPFDLLENHFYGKYWSPFIQVNWESVPVEKEDIADYLTIKNLNRSFRDSFASRVFFEYYQTDDWSCDFYRRQAKLGFIAIAERESGWLMPQLQSEYAVLDWKNLHVCRKVRKIINSGRMERENISLNISSDPEIVLEELADYWKHPTWLTENYKKLMRMLAEPEEAEKDRSFQVLGITLTAGKETKPVAGELGYIAGRTYTSLSGFFRRDNKTCSNFGKLQMVLLARELEKKGIEFWNLGHPYMDYKTALGAKIIPRKVFLKKWDNYVNEKFYK